MASLRTQSAARLVRNAMRPRIALASIPRRFESSAAKPADVVPAMPSANQPDYDVPLDKATSYDSYFRPFARNLSANNA